MSSMATLRTYARLGPSNITRVAAYRLGLKSGLHPVQQLAASVPGPIYFRASERDGSAPAANTAWNDTLLWFDWHRQPLSAGPPDWFANPFSEARQPNAARDWWRIPDFDSGDIKGLWELSRFNWLLAWATTTVRGDAVALERMNLWLSDWALSNPPYKGPNWKCGQEASIRVMHLVTAAWLLRQDHAPERGLVDLLTTHLQRIAPTMSYAIGQQNNHGTSEAAALFLGGSLLADQDPRADDWASKGRRWLEELATTLIEPDGSFSQYSVTYHRVMLDTYALAEAWRRHRNLSEFSGQLLGRLRAATRWLMSIVDTISGDAPNIGANDGTRLLQFTGGDYRDFRPSVQLAMALFEGRNAYGDGPWSAPLQWFEVTVGEPSVAPQSVSFVAGGYHILRAGDAMAVLRFPNFRFRPSQADALHVDLWHNGNNLLRDAGTYSYNAEDTEWFSSTAAHNTIEFDGRDQMRRLGRFLFGDWLEADNVERVQEYEQEVTASACYTDYLGAHHYRKLTLRANSFECSDTISGNFTTACLRWRLLPGNWNVHGTCLRSNGLSLAVFVDGRPVIPQLGVTRESRYYQQQSQVPLAIVRLNRPATLMTKLVF